MPSPTTRVEVATRPDRAELVAAHLWAAGAIGVQQTGDGVIAWFPGTELPAGLQPGSEASPPVPEFAPEALRVAPEPDRDWQEEWKATIGPVDAGRFTIVPSWLAADHRPRPDEHTLVLDPGRAFGTGHHATTTLCLELLDSTDRAQPVLGRSVADIGCGTGVLAIAAARLGARPVTAVDIDGDAVDAARANAAANDAVLDLAVGSVEVLDTAAEVVLANLVTDVVVALAAPLVAATRARLIVSGIATARRDRAVQALEAAGAHLVDERHRDGWVALAFTPAGPGDHGATT